MLTTVVRAVGAAGNISISEPLTCLGEGLVLAQRRGDGVITSFNLLDHHQGEGGSVVPAAELGGAVSALCWLNGLMVVGYDHGAVTVFNSSGSPSPSPLKAFSFCIKKTKVLALRSNINSDLLEVHHCSTISRGWSVVHSCTITTSSLRGMLEGGGGGLDVQWATCCGVTGGPALVVKDVYTDGRVVVVLGADPFMSLYYVPEGPAAHSSWLGGINSMAGAAVSQAVSMVWGKTPGVQYLPRPTGPGELEELKGVSFSHSGKSVLDFYDEGRVCTGLLVPQGQGPLLSTDTYGRILYVCPHTLRVLHVWKGYRDAQLSWSSDRNKTNVLVVLAPRRSLLELWDLGTLVPVRLTCCSLVDHGEVRLLTRGYLLASGGVLLKVQRGDDASSKPPLEDHQPPGAGAVVEPRLHGAGDFHLIES